jgi:soluble P-type ATPase
LAEEELHQTNCEVVLLEPEKQAQAKQEFVQRLGIETTAAIGNGRDDVQMVHLAALAIAVIGREGVACEVLEVADVVAPDINSAVGLLQNTQRLVATLRA